MKKNWIMRSAYLALAVLLISTVAVSGTFAKYTWSSNAVSDTTSVAKFGFVINGATIDEATDKDINIDIFNDTTRMDVDTKNDNILVDGEDDVIANKVAPGVGGMFTLSFQNLSEVTVALDFSNVETTNVNNIPLEFATANTVEGWAAAKTDLNDLVTTLDNEYAMNQGSATELNIYWRWDWDDANDATDTTLGFAGTATYAVSFTATVNQVN